MTVRSTTRKGFTLVEILIVVIILGILAAIVIPQFTSASQDARKNSLTSQLQTLRSQIELFKVNHADIPPDVANLTTMLLGKSDTTMTTTAYAATSSSGSFGPYVQTFPVNPLNGKSAVATAAATGIGWLYNVTNTNYTIQATDTTMTGSVSY